MNSVVMIDRVVRMFPRHREYTLGVRLRDSSLAALVGVMRAHPKATRQPALPEPRR